MTVELLVPTLGESVVEATVAKWMKSPGESINSDEPLVELETEKVTLEVPSPISGVLKEISAKEGESVEVGALLGIISESNNESPTKNTSLQKNKEEKRIEKSPYICFHIMFIGASVSQFHHSFVCNKPCFKNCSSHEAF